MSDGNRLVLTDAMLKDWRALETYIKSLPVPPWHDVPSYGDDINMDDIAKLLYALQEALAVYDVIEARLLAEAVIQEMGIRKDDPYA